MGTMAPLGNPGRTVTGERDTFRHAVCRAFGIRRATEQQQAIARERIEELVANGLLDDQSGHLTVAVR